MAIDRLCSLPSAKADSLRYELKLVCRQTSHARVLMALRMNPASLRTLFPTRRVQSIYFDSPQGRSLQDNLAGISDRRKVRFRWYGDECRQVDGHLEMKVRENTLGWKHTCPIEGLTTVLDQPRNEFTAALRRQVDPIWQVNLDRGLAPVQWISYQRDYFITGCGKVRVTMDHDLQSWDQREKWCLNNRYPTPIQRLVIVEVKCLPDHYEEASRVVERLPLMVGKSSKFVMASNPGEGPLDSYLDR